MSVIQELFVERVGSRTRTELDSVGCHQLSFVLNGRAIKNFSKICAPNKCFVDRVVDLNLIEHDWVGFILAVSITEGRAVNNCV